MEACAGGRLVTLPSKDNRALSRSDVVGEVAGDGPSFKAMTGVAGAEDTSECYQHSDSTAERRAGAKNAIVAVKRAG